jgi:hypothetical protein
MNVLNDERFEAKSYFEALWRDVPLIRRSVIARPYIASNKQVEMTAPIRPA